MSSPPTSPFDPPRAPTPGPSPRAPEPEATGARPTRLWIGLVALGCWPFAGVGHVIAGRARRSVPWLATTALGYAGLVLATYLGSLWLFAAALAGFVVTVAWAGISAVRAPLGAPPRHPIALGLGVIAVTRVLSRLLVFATMPVFRVPTGGQEPNIHVGDHIAVTRLDRDAKRGDIITLVQEGTESKHVKRVVALPGEVVEIVDEVVHIDGRPLARERVETPCPTHAPPRDELELGGTPPPCTIWRETNGEVSYDVQIGPHASSFGPLEIPPGTVFVLGDHRTNSADSRTWGPVPIERVYGRVAFTVMCGAPELDVVHEVR